MLRERHWLIVVALIFLAMVSALLVGCPPGMQITKENLPQTPQDKADYFMGYYLAQKTDYKTRLAMATEMSAETGELVWKPTVTKIEKAVLRAKYQFIKEGEAPITLYDTYASQGKVPTMQMEIAINALIGRLEEELIKAGQNK